MRTFYQRLTRSLSPQLDIISGTLNLVDSFEWDLESGTSPEEFAEVYAADLGLNGEFK